MFGRAADPFLPADHMADSHVVIIDHIGEMVSGESISFTDYLMIDLVQATLPSAQLIGEGAFLFGYFIQPQKADFGFLADSGRKDKQRHHTGESLCSPSGLPLIRSAFRGKETAISMTLLK